jgi:hypothetical protein
MSLTVWLAADTLGYPEGGGHLWVYLNWALGLRSLGCRVVWLEVIDSHTDAGLARQLVAGLQSRLACYGLGGALGLALCSPTAESVPADIAGGCLDLDAAGEADLLLNMAYSACPRLPARFRSSALIDIDPGLLQIWLSEGVMQLARHDVYFTTSEVVGQPGARFPDGGVSWQFTPPCVALDWWPVSVAAEAAPFTTVSHWSSSKEWVTYAEESYHNDKRSGFLPFLDLPRQTQQSLELALCLAADEDEERRMLEQRGWRVRHAHTVASTPWDYQHYIQQSRGEFSCVKPSCVRLQNAWVSDRTLCYLASGKPAVVQDTGPSRYLPGAAGLLRFRDIAQAVHCLELVEADYGQHCQYARALAEEFFDARKVAQQVLERALA